MESSAEFVLALEGHRSSVRHFHVQFFKKLWNYAVPPIFFLAFPV